MLKKKHIDLDHPKHLVDEMTIHTRPEIIKQQSYQISSLLNINKKTNYSNFW